MRWRFVLALAAVLAAVGAIVYALWPRGAAPEPRAAGFGADMGVLFQDHYPVAVVSRALTGAADAGLGVGRVAPLWELTEPRPPLAGHHHYDWRYDDFIARELAGHGFRWLAVLGFAPGWAAVAPAVLHAAPRGTAAYAAYAAAVARRYRGLISAFEVWNEENTPVFWRPAPDPVAYARLYLAARQAIHRVDPKAPVLIGGLVAGHRKFLRGLLLQPGLRGMVDGVAIHAYGPDPSHVLGQVRSRRLELNALGFGGVPLYLTEYGWSSRQVSSPGPGAGTIRANYAPAPVRGPFIVQTARDLLSSDCNIRAATFYAWLTPQSGPHSIYGWYGVASPDGATTATSDAIAQGARSLTRRRAVTARVC
ncbi:MAG: hypothetical protein ACJ764_05610 [Solirubrobacteraceae bacterium]